MAKGKGRDAAAVIVTRGAGRDLEVLLVERSPELRFFGGYLAFPGGVLDPADRELGPERAFRACAERELFEELGIALGRMADLGAEDREMLREQLLAEAAGAAARFIALAGLADSAGALTPVCRIRTPPFAPVRYDTEFFAVELPAGAVPDVRPGELVGSRFWRPAAALAAWRRGEVAIVPPALILLELLGGGEVDFVARAAALAQRYRDGALHRVQFSPGIVMASVATPTLPPATTTNCLLVGCERLWIVDPATPYPAEQERLFALIDELRAEGRRPAGILVTHHHEDHVGAVAATSRRYGLPVRGHPLTLARLPVGFTAGEPLGDGDRIGLGIAPDGSTGWELEAIHTPGHDRGHLCFRESRYRALLAGDMLSTVSTVVIDPPEGHLATYLASLDRLLRAEIDTLYPAHGPAVRDGAKLIRHYLRHRAQRETALIAALGELGPAAPATLVPKVYWEVDASLYGLAERSLCAGLDKLAEEGRAAVAGGLWSLTGR